MRTQRCWRSSRAAETVLLSIGQPATGSTFFLARTKAGFDLCSNAVVCVVVARPWKSFSRTPTATATL